MNTTDVFFLINLHKKYYTILLHLQKIVDIYDDMVDIYDDMVDIDIEEDRKYYLEKITHITQTIKNVTKDIQENCNHHFVNDSIDIDCECSQNITYCTICEYTKC
jgi:hypothetical protein